MSATLLVTVRGIGYRFGRSATRPAGRAAALIDLRELRFEAEVTAG